jgi:hypothetical protein
MNHDGSLEARHSMQERAQWLRAVWNARMLLRLLGLSALALAVILTAVGFVIYGKEMGPHIIAVSIGILGEAAVVVLVLDRVTGRQKKEEWSFVRRVVGHGASACMVDLLRFCCIRWSPKAFDANHERYDEFVRITRLHLANWRSNLEGLALGAEPGAYEQAWQIGFQLAWLADQLSQVPNCSRRPGPEYQIVLKTMHQIGEFLIALTREEFEDHLATARAIIKDLDRIRSPEESDEAADDFFHARQSAQEKLIRLKPTLGLGIWYDISQGGLFRRGCQVCDKFPVSGAPT